MKTKSHYQILLADELLIYGVVRVVFMNLWNIFCTITLQFVCYNQELQG